MLYCRCITREALRRSRKNNFKDIIKIKGLKPWAYGFNLRPARPLLNALLSMYHTRSVKKIEKK
ncbi:MAG: hypothetical protein IJP88_09500 [Synergistaceae bacterium]|nr:hypothetical protein [Synergistaceae bacterium]MBR0097405.1 hypothetical protein [Synergistaceae bacterium]